MYFCAVFLSRVHATFWLRIDQFNGVLIGVGIWYQMNPVTDLHDTRTRKRRQKMASIYVKGICL